jgi:PhnB protein
MSAAPEGYHTLTPRILLGEPSDVAPFVEFLRGTFGATGEVPGGRPAEIRIGDSLLMISSTDLREPASAFLYVYVDDADATYARAMASGATSMEEPLTTSYGDRRAMVRDPWGNTWQIATRAG